MENVFKYFVNLKNNYNKEFHYKYLRESGF